MKSHLEIALSRLVSLSSFNDALHSHKRISTTPHNHLPLILPLFFVFFFFFYNMEMTKGTVDVSCYLCFEATGDSESPSETINKDPNIACRIPICCDDDDDAQSCCYDTSDQSLNSDELLINGYEYSDEDEVEMCVYGTTTYEDEDEDEDDCEIQKQKKVRVCVDSGAEKVDEMEKNRLFWEACLAS